MTDLSNKVKYPRSYHLPFSPGATSDDKKWSNEQAITYTTGKDLVVTEKMDGSNVTLYSDYYHNRSINTSYHPAFDWIKRHHSEIAINIPNELRICGEYLYNTHSISYDNLESYFYGFSVWEGAKCLSWEDTLEWFKLLDITPVPTVAENIGYNEKLITAIGEYTVNQGKEGIVIRNIDSFNIDSFSQNLAKYVRANHVTSSEHWLHSKLVQNKLGVK